MVASSELCKDEPKVLAVHGASLDTTKLASRMGASIQASWTDAGESNVKYCVVLNMSLQKSKKYIYIYLRHLGPVVIDNYQTFTVEQRINISQELVLCLLSIHLKQNNQLTLLLTIQSSTPLLL